MPQAITNPATRQENKNQFLNVRAISNSRFGDDGDAALVNSVRAGDSTAFNLLVERHQRRLLNVALKITKNREDAEDAVQDSLLNAFNHLDSFRGDSRFLSWLTRITINQALMTLRKNPQKTVSIDERTASEESTITSDRKAGRYTPERLCSHREFERLLFDRAAGINDKLRRVLELRAFEGLVDKEIAQVLGLTLTAVKTRLFRARRQLRKRMEQHLSSPNVSRDARISKRHVHASNKFIRAQKAG